MYLTIPLQLKLPDLSKIKIHAIINRIPKCAVFGILVTGAFVSILISNILLRNILNPSTSLGLSKPAYSIAIESLDHLPQVACGIYTYHGQRALITESYVTWGHLCQTFEAFSDEVWEYSPGKVTVPLRTYPGNKADLWNDVRKIWDYWGDRYKMGTLHADFVTFSGDDAFFIVPSLRKYLGTFASPGDSTWLLLGGIDAYRRFSDFPWIGGAGYVVSRQLVEQKVLLRCPEEATQAEDILTSRCLYQHGVNFTDTADSSGRYRFCRSYPRYSCDYLIHVKPSDEVVLFHYTTGRVRKRLAKKYHSVEK